MKVILAGAAKTGTKTMAAAFTVLGFNTYDYLENYFYLHKEWLKIFDGSATNEDIRRMFDGVDSLTDAPTCIYWEELQEAFPEAKIILTTRDEDSWYKSLINQFETGNASFLAWIICVISPQSILRLSYSCHVLGRFFGDHAGWPSFKLRPFHEKVQRALFRQHNYNVLKKAPMDKLLVYNVSEGWEPLCEFLGVEIPDKPFPHKNKGGTFIDELVKTSPVVHQMLFQGAMSATLMTLCVGYAGYRLYKTSSGQRWGTWILQNAQKAVERVRDFQKS
uniref:Uncharacterized protein LOC100178565 n=1 Tax=Phallusia mammillata TaxID=59560 RepID=A0A6F9DGW6_9ASCI|nr:uncharacterized protein LOC100178565 [Phallusia mammillata]